VVRVAMPGSTLAVAHGARRSAARLVAPLTSTTTSTPLAVRSNTRSLSSRLRLPDEFEDAAFVPNQ
jgi:hypothetical protein